MSFSGSAQPSTNTPSLSSFAGSSFASGSYPYDSNAYVNGYGYSSTGPKIALKALLASAFLQYTTTAIAMPWEVGKVLLQVQWVPKHLEASDLELELELELEEEEEDNDELSESSTDDSYFHDPTSPTRHRQARARPLPTRKMSNPTGKMHSYPLVIPYGPADGVWGMMKRVGRWRTEGWISLWKGLLTSVTLTLLTSTIQPSVSAFLRPIFPSSQSRHFPPLLLPLAAHVITGIILSPLDTLRTLQIIHPRPSPSPLTHFTLLASSNHTNEEKITLAKLYTEPTLLYPAILDNTLRPLISLTMPRVIEHMTGVRIGVNIWMYPLCEFVGGVIGLALTIPVETVRRRLQAQIVVHGIPNPNTPSSTPVIIPSRPSEGRVPSCVHLSPRPYKGILDCVWRILTEERSGSPLHAHSSRRKGGRRPSVRSPPPATASAAVTPKARRGKAKPRLSGGSNVNKRDVRTVFDADVPAAGPSHLRTLSEEMRASERRVSQPQAAPSLSSRVEHEFEKVKADAEHAGGGLDGWLEGIEGTGIGQLYRGFGMGVGALALVLVLGLITGEEAEGWAEL